MKIEFNIKVDEPTSNKTIYPKEVIKKAFDEKLNNTFPITLDHVTTGHNNATIVSFKDICGTVENYKINNDNSIVSEIITYENPHGKLLKEILDTNKFKSLKFQINGIGIIKNGVVEEYKIISTSIDKRTLKSE